MWIFTYLILTFVGLFGLLMIFQRIKDYVIYKTRDGERKEDFINHFVREGISENLAHFVYQYLQDWMNIKDFPVRPQDDLAIIYGIADEELDDLIIESAKTNNLEIPANSDYWGSPVVTVADSIRFVASFKQKS